MSRGPLTITDYERVPDGVNPPMRYPDYRSSVTRSPDQPLVVAPHTLSELTGPVYGNRPIGPLERRLLHPNAEFFAQHFEAEQSGDFAVYRITSDAH